MLTTFSGVAANFAGIPLAFAFIATLGTIGIVTSFLQNAFGFSLYEWTPPGSDTTFSLFSKTGIEIVYLYFQIPLMILVIAPAIDGLRREWREAASSLGASSWQFWRYVGFPILFPSLLSAMVLLFGNSFAAYATAYGLTAGGIGLVPIVIGFFIGGDVLDDPHLAQALAFGMFVVLGLMMLAYIPLQTAQLEVGAMTPRRFIAPTAVVWLLIGAAYFLDPAHRDAPLQPEERPDGQVLHACELRRRLRRPGVLEDDPAELRRSRSRRSPSRSCSSSRPSTGCT